MFPPTSLRGQTFTPPFVLRMGFGAIFAGAGYVLASGDSRNGSGIATGNSTLKHTATTLNFDCSLVLKLSRSRAVFTRVSTIASSPTQPAFYRSFERYSGNSCLVRN
jgi:Altered inheritance of mitochondria protein 19